MDKEELTTKVQNLLKEDQIKKALEILLNFSVNNYDRKYIVIQSASFSRINSAFRNGFISWEESFVHKNRIIDAIFSILDEITSRNFASFSDDILLKILDSKFTLLVDALNLKEEGL